jgi:MFS family permease
MRKEYLPVAFLSFVNTLGFSLLIPLWPFIIEDFGGNTITYGLLLSTYPAFQFFGSPVLGNLSDKYGRRPVLILSQLGTLLSWFLFCLAFAFDGMTVIGISLPLVILLISRAIDGATGGNVSVANAYLSDITEPEERSKAFGLMGAILGIGIVIGPALGSLSSSTPIGYLGTGFVAIIISSITLGVLILWIKESLIPEHRQDNVSFKIYRQLNIPKRFSKYTSNRLLKYILTSRVFFAIAFSSYTSVMILFLIDKFGLDESTIGVIMLITGVFLIINQGFIMNRVVRRIGELKTLKLGLFFAMVGFALHPFLPSVEVYLILAYITFLGVSLAMPNFKVILTQNTKRNEQGEISGLDESILAACSAVFPLVASILYSGLSFYIFIVLAGVISIPLILGKFKYKDIT